MNLTAEIKTKGGAFIRVMSTPEHPVVPRRVIIAAQDFEFEVDAAELVAAIQACCIKPSHGRLVSTGQFQMGYAGVEAENHLKRKFAGTPFDDINGDDYD